jgi:hypothetical protein
MVSLTAAEAVPALSGTLAVVKVLRATDPDSFLAAQVPVLDLDFGGVIGDRHHGLRAPRTVGRAASTHAGR